MILDAVLSDVLVGALQPLRCLVVDALNKLLADGTLGTHKLTGNPIGGIDADLSRSSPQ